MALLVSLAGCGGSDSGAGAAPVTSLDAVTVNGAKGAKPTVKFAHPFSVSQTDRRVLIAGSGSTVVRGQRVSIDYVGINGTDGREFDSSYGKQPTSFMIDSTQVIKGFASGLAGVKVGSRVLLAIPPKDAYGVRGVPAVGIGPTDTLIFVIDVRAANKVLSKAEGTAVTPRSGLPVVKRDARGKPTITLPRTRPPTSLVVQPLITGKGPKVRTAQTITVQYTGVIWPGGRVFDSSWARGTPAQFPIGVGKVISGWDEALVGKTVGSEVLIVVPPDKGYGAAGNAQAGIKGTDTLVFVVDILDAA
jgi:peptidylprolyl isomerase